MILFVGDKPSKRTDPNVPFKGAACEKRLMEWIKHLTTGNYGIVNSVDMHFRLAVFEYSNMGYPIVALGNNASKSLGKVPHFKLPHPSGRNRQINNKEFIDQKLEECLKYIQNYD